MTAVDNFDPFYARAIKEEGISNLRRDERFRLVELDVVETNALMDAVCHQPIDTIVHLAAKAGVRPSIGAPMAYARANVLGTQSVLEVARQLDVRDFVFGSSSSVYGNSDVVPFREDSPAQRPVSPYAATKQAGELAAYVYHHLYGISIHCLRFFTVYGPRQRPDLAIHKYARHLLEGRPIPMYGDGTTSRDYTYVDDIVGGVSASLQRLRTQDGPEFEVFNLGGSETTQLRHLIEGLAEALSVDQVLVDRLPMQAGDVFYTRADISKARRLLGYEPKTNIREGLQKFADWARSYYAIHQG